MPQKVAYDAPFNVRKKAPPMDVSMRGALMGITIYLMEVPCLSFKK